MKDNFDPNMTYCQSLRIVARGIVQFPFRAGDIRYLRSQAEEIGEALLAVGCILGGWILRVVAMILLPISAPLLTWIVQIERRKTAERIAARKAEAQAQAEKLWRRQPEPDEHP